MAKIVILGSFADSLIDFRGPLMKEMTGLGNEVVACVPDATPRVIEQLTALGIRYESIELSRAGLNPLQDIKTLTGLYRLFRKLKPDSILSYTVKPVIYGSIAASLAGVPKIYSMITGLGYVFIGKGWKSRILGKIVQMLYRLGLNVNQKVFFQNRDDLDLFYRLKIIRKKEKSVLINGSGVDLSYYKPTDFPEKLSFLLIARLLADKGIREYANAAEQIKQKASYISFKLAGWVDENPASISKTELNGWINKGIIEFLGKLDDIRPAMAGSSVYVLPSYREGMPRTVLEAMSMGRPVITTDAPGCRETVEHGENGFIVEIRDVGQLKSAIETFIHKPDIIPAMGKKSRELAEKKFDVNKVNHEILKHMELACEKSL